ncbi:hypothetical protein FA15DRAFT_660212 [Coprinopsis marcescibilis]|uniref:Uncharacterized protein n=1 Tax=Coprinopsis marcescibilis TaxID=230819 RepID=A0A5C3KG62_COPMA|nr:hypothetical protein FA15DRAFT_660212 [Coprinopsis marcescibilis]
MSSPNPSPEVVAAQSSVPPPIDLKHMTSNSLLSPTAMLSAGLSPSKEGHHHHRTADRGNRRTSQNLRAVVEPRMGSPGSIPSSPTSVHSSSSAIFERDIEPMISPTSPPYLHSPTSPQRQLDPHRIPRAKATEQLEQAVPSVLDSAAAVLATLDMDTVPNPSDKTSPIEKTTFEQVSVVAPASSTVFEGLGGHGARSSGFASPLSFRSRSPSPLGSRTARSGDPLVNLSSNVINTTSVHTVSSTSTSPFQSPTRSTSTSPSLMTASLSSSPPRAPQMAHSISKDSAHATTSGAAGSSDPAPSLITPTSTYFSATSVVEPLDTFRALPVSSSPISANLTLLNTTSTSPPSTSAASPSTASHPPSPHHVANKRLSFMSYSDLLSSTPASTLPLVSLTKDASAIDPPPHIPSVSGLNLISAAASVASNSSIGGGLGGSTTASLRGFSLGVGGGLGPAGGLTHPGKRDSIALLDNVGGEWEREGLGMGLEERLDAAALGSGSYANSPAAVVSVLPTKA